MNTWLSNVLNQAHFHMQEQLRPEPLKWEKKGTGNWRVPIETKLKQYKNSIPKCCSREEFIGWLEHTHSQKGRITADFCRDCTPQHRAAMQILGKCGRSK